MQMPREAKVEDPAHAVEVPDSTRAAHPLGIRVVATAAPEQEVMLVTIARPPQGMLKAVIEVHGPEMQAAQCTARRQARMAQHGVEPPRKNTR